MTRHPRYDILFEPVRIGPVVAKNRFYQVPHCNGMGYRDPSAVAAMRAIRAEGGWSVVNTEQAEIHPTSDMSPLVEMRLWDDRDIPAAALVAEAIKKHGALAGCEPGHNGLSSNNFFSRETPLGPSDRPVMPVTTHTIAPLQGRRMDKADIRAMHKWHRDAARRAKTAGFDLVYVYGGHGQCIADQFLSLRYNDRSDEYGGPLVNRVRLLRELIEITKDEVGDTCAVPVRLSFDPSGESHGLGQTEMEDVIGLIADLPDLFDLHMSGWDFDSRTSRFGEEGQLEEYLINIKKITAKPVVAVGRYTSPDRMVSLVKKGVLDFIGAARPSIADPFLPKKVEEGRIEDIRECIGCNICVTGDATSSPIRCTQNPTMGEEWRSGWHPERIRPKRSDATVLVVGAGPTGLEAGRALGQRGYKVTIAEARDAAGGRVSLEALLPGLSAWGRVRDYRTYQINQMANVDLYLGSHLSAGEVEDFGADHVLIATGSTWRRDGMGRTHQFAIPTDADAQVLTPDDLMAGTRPQGDRVVVYDDDHYYMGGILAELLAREGKRVTLVTPAAQASIFMNLTMEQRFVQKRLIELGVEIVGQRLLSRIGRGSVTTACAYTGREADTATDAVVLVTARLPEDGLFLALQEKVASGQAGSVKSIRCVGDAWAPATIAHAVNAGRRYAEELEEDMKAYGDGRDFNREMTAISRDAAHVRIRPAA
jgi:dimethylamine/trimethylamine dehydrogenase